MTSPTSPETSTKTRPRGACSRAARSIAGDIGLQTRTAIERIAATLAECGASLPYVVRATVWLADLRDFSAFNVEYKSHFDGALPARSTVEAKLYGDTRVDIEVQAWLAT